MSFMEWEFKNNQYQPKQKTMEKPKFASVRFKPLDWKLEFQDTGSPCWASYLVEGDPWSFVRFAEQYILANPDYFEVTYPERPFEKGAYYKAKRNKNDKWAIVYFDGHFFSRTFDMTLYKANNFYEIGDKIEL